VLSPEQTEGPYYVSGEMVRKNVKDNEQGIDLHLDIQIVDMSTCSPIPGIALDMWHANATGVYSGIVMYGNGVPNKSNQNNKALRGIQISNKDGAVQFETIMPGHYMGRTHHIHSKHFSDRRKGLYEAVTYL
jgi:protocatechuate 3,4-dioxygenase beta subunit